VRFVLVDRIVSLEPGKSIVAERFIRPDEEYFQDHFPGFPVVPGVLLTEMMAQAAGKCLDAQRLPRGKAMLARILSASFRQWVRPGDDTILHASISSNEERYATADCQAKVNDAVVAQARLFFSFMPTVSFAADLRDAVLESYLEGEKK
jgi:3-hydroxyacyl-[acyl-carrier-protein] dehydratase